MTVLEYELLGQISAVHEYVKQGTLLLCSEDIQRLKTLECIEGNLSSWQRRYFQLQDENQWLHDRLATKDELLQHLMQAVSASKEQHDQLIRQDIENKEEIQSLKRCITESNKTYSELCAKIAHDAETINRLETEINEWTQFAENRQNLSASENRDDFNKNLYSLINEKSEKKSLNLDPFLADIEAIENLSQQFQNFRQEIADLTEKCNALIDQNDLLQDECRSKTEILSNLSKQEDFQTSSCIQNKLIANLTDDLNNANSLLHEARSQQDALKSLNEDLRNELECQKYRNDALDELLSNNVSAKVQKESVVDLQKYHQIEQERDELQSQLSAAHLKKDLALQRLEESEARVRKLETKCQTLQESLDSDDEIRVKYRELFKELEEAMSVNKRLKDANQELEDRLKKLNSEFDAKSAECDRFLQELQEISEQYRLFKENAIDEAKQNRHKIENLQSAFEKKAQLEVELRSQLEQESARFVQLKEQSDSLQEELAKSDNNLYRLKSEYDDLKSRYECLRIESEGLTSQIECLEVAKETALDIVSSTKSQLIEAESRENVLKDSNQSLRSALANLTEDMKAAVQENLGLESEFRLKNEQCMTFEKEVEANSEQILALKQQIDSLKENINSANLQHVEDAERVEAIQTENKLLKLRLDKLEDMNKLLQQDLPTSHSDDSVISRERTKTKALSKQVAILKKKSKDLERDAQRWKALYEKELVAKNIEI